MCVFCALMHMRFYVCVSTLPVYCIQLLCTENQEQCAQGWMITGYLKIQSDYEEPAAPATRDRVS